MPQSGHYVYSARTTEKGLALLNKTKGPEMNWDRFINEAVCAHYNLPLDVIQLPPSKFLAERDEKRKAKEAEKAAKKAEREAQAKEKAKAKADAKKEAAKKGAKKPAKKANGKPVKTPAKGTSGEATVQAAIETRNIELKT